MERLAAHEPAQLLDLRTHRQPHLQPVGTRAIDRDALVRGAPAARPRPLDLAGHLERDRDELCH
jgi:hypothetical protein